MDIPPGYSVPKTFFKMRKDGHAAIWIVYISEEYPDTVQTEHGNYKKGGDFWTVPALLKQRGRNIGKSNYKSPAKVAREVYKKLVKAKMAEGYKQVSDVSEIFDGNDGIPPAVEDFPYMLTLDEECPSFRAPKPQNTLKEGSTLWKLAMSGSATFVRKMDGYGFIIVKEGGLIEGYTLKLQRISPVDNTTYFDRLLKVQQWFDAADGIIPDRTMFFGEIIPIDEDCMIEETSYQYVTSILKSKLKPAMERQSKESDLGIYLWDVAFWAGIPVSKLCPYRLRLELIADLVQSVEGGSCTDQLGRSLVKAAGYDPINVDHCRIRIPKDPYVVREPELLHIPENTPDPVRYAVNTAKNQGYEGWVVVNLDKAFGQKAWSLSGRVERSPHWAKLKPKLEDDFIARWNPEEGFGEYGNGANFDRIGAVDLYQWDGDDLRYCGQCGQGFSESQRERFMKLLRAEPQVFQVEFHEWTTKGKLRIPVFLRHRTDKDVGDCDYSGPS